MKKLDQAPLVGQFRTTRPSLEHKDETRAAFIIMSQVSTLFFRTFYTYLIGKK